MIHSSCRVAVLGTDVKQELRRTVGFWENLFSVNYQIDFNGLELLLDCKTPLCLC